MTTLAACGGDSSEVEEIAETVESIPASPESNFSIASTARKTNTPFDYIKYRDGLSRAEGLENGELTPSVLVEDAIARTEQVNEHLNAIVTDLFDDAKTVAQSAEGNGFSGQPTFIKDLDDWKGAPTLYGSRAFKGRPVATGYGEFVGTWQKAGLIALGKSTTPEMGLTSCTEPLLTGPTRNPWNKERIPGGSSGGAAALVASRVVPFAHASDGGGSIRIPAACCGVFGLKPSRGALAESDSRGRGIDISVNNAVSLTVRDSIKLFSIAQNDKSKLATEEATDPIDQRLKIAFLREPMTSAKLDDATREGINSAAKLCEELGHEVTEWEMPIIGEEFADNFLLLWSAGAAQFSAQAAGFKGVKPTQEDLKDIVEPWTLHLAGNFLGRQDEMPAAIQYLNDFESLYHSWFDDFDVILSPTVSTVAPEIGAQAPDGDYETVLKNVLDFAAFTSPMNVSGAASMSVPLYWSKENMPVGAMFSAKKGDDVLLFRLALELEKARPWIDRIPPINAL